MNLDHVSLTLPRDLRTLHPNYFFHSCLLCKDNVSIHFLHYLGKAKFQSIKSATLESYPPRLMNTTQSLPTLTTSDLIPISILIVLTVGWVIIYTHLLKIYNLILQTNKSFRHFIRLTMSQMKKIKLESRDLEERRDTDYIHEPMKLLKFSYSCLILQPFHPIPQPNLNFKLIWDCKCNYQPNHSNPNKMCVCPEASIKVDLIDSVKLICQTTVVPKSLPWHTPQDTPHQ